MIDAIESGMFGVLSLHDDLHLDFPEEEKWPKDFSKSFTIKRGFLGAMDCYYIVPAFLENLAFNWKNQHFDRATEVHITCPFRRSKNEDIFEGRVLSTLHYTIKYDSWSFRLYFDAKGVLRFTTAYNIDGSYPLDQKDRIELHKAFQPHLKFLRELFEQKAIFLSKQNDKLIKMLSELSELPHSSSNDEKIENIKKILEIQYKCTDGLTEEKIKEYNITKKRFVKFLEDISHTEKNTPKLPLVQPSVNVLTAPVVTNKKAKPYSGNDKLSKKKMPFQYSGTQASSRDKLAEEFQENFDIPSLENIKNMLDAHWGKIDIAKQYKIFLEKITNTVNDISVSEKQQKKIEILYYLQRQYPYLQSIVFAFNKESNFYCSIWHAKCKVLAWFFLHNQLELYYCFINLGLDPWLETVNYKIRYASKNGFAIWKPLSEEEYDRINPEIKEAELISSLTRDLGKSLNKNEACFQLTKTGKIRYKSILTDGKWCDFFCTLPPPQMESFKSNVTQCIKTGDFSLLQSENKNVILKQLYSEGSLHQAYKQYNADLLIDYICKHSDLISTEIIHSVHTALPP
ncbi:MAG: hypothetical protein V4496_00070, partial [Pseudomonadota bacterium]